MESFFKKIIDKVRNSLTNDIGIDLGTVNTLVHIKGKGIIYNEPSLVAVNQKTGKIVAIGHKALEMLGKAPKHINIIHPLVDGVVSDFEVTEELMRYLLRLVQKKYPKFFGPRAVIGVPSEITNVEQRAVRSATRNAGARVVHIIPEPLAAAVGIGVPIGEIRGEMIVDIGGGTSDIMVISMEGIVASKNVRVAGQKMNDAIVNHIREVFKLLIGLRSAEELKKHTSPFILEDSRKRFAIRGRNIVSGLPQEITVTGQDVQHSISHLTEEIIEGIKEVLELAPPEISADLYKRGLYLVGGGALIQGLPEVISKEIGILVKVPEDPLLSVAYGAGIIANDVDSYKNILIPDDDDE
ncbi:MAG: rod shape-determining protein [Candidatus Campbellbacteria bacterium]|nr:rod shape-determining protein [Candidatus Campbellbacteria bacterium]